MKAQIDADDASGLANHVECTAANVWNVTQAHELLNGKGDVVFGASGYAGLAKRDELINPRSREGRNLSGGVRGAGEAAVSIHAPARGATPLMISR